MTIPNELLGPASEGIDGTATIHVGGGATTRNAVAGVVLDAVPDGWAKLNGQWVDLTDLEGPGRVEGFGVDGLPHVAFVGVADGGWPLYAWRDDVEQYAAEWLGETGPNPKRMWRCALVPLAEVRFVPPQAARLDDADDLVTRT